MATSMQPVVLLCTVFLAGLLGALAQTTPKPIDALDATTSGYNDSSYLSDFKFPPKNENATFANTAAAFVGTGLVGRIFVVKPCTFGTVPHFHPNSSEYFIGVEGKMKVYVYNGGKLIVDTLEPNKGVKTHVAPRSNLHFYLNDECEQAAVLSVLNPLPGGPGFFGYFNPPTVFSDVKATAADVAALIKTAIPTATGTPGIFPLTDKCTKRCARKRHGRKQYWDDDDDK